MCPQLLPFLSVPVSPVGGGGRVLLSHMSTRAFAVGLHVHCTLYICEWGMLV